MKPRDGVSDQKLEEIADTRRSCLIQHEKMFSADAMVSKEAVRKELERGASKQDGLNLYEP